MGEARPVLFLLGANHRSAPVELRERLFIPEERLELLLPALKERHRFLEIAALSTCNRFELFGVVEQPRLSATDLFDAFLELHQQGATAPFTSPDELRSHMYLHVDEEAVSHAYRVAASLDSLVLGETQITGQFKDALALATKARTIGPLLNRLGQEAMATAKKVRSQTAIGKKPVSIAHAALSLAGKVFGDLGAHRFLVVGAGEMASVSARYIVSKNPRALMVANRTPAKAATVVEDVGFGTAYGLEDLPALLGDADVVICSTASTLPLIDQSMVVRAQAHRRGRPMILLDIAVPRNIDPACGKLDDVYVFDVDDLQQVVGANLEERRKAAEEAQGLITRGVDQFRTWQKTVAVAPALSAFRRYLEALVEKEGAKTMGRGLFRDLSPEQREAIRALLGAVVSKVSGDAARHITAPPAGFFQEQLADALSALFGDDVSNGGNGV